MIAAEVSQTGSSPAQRQTPTSTALLTIGTKQLCQALAARLDGDHDPL